MSVTVLVLYMLFFRCVKSYRGYGYWYGKLSRFVNRLGHGMYSCDIYLFYLNFASSHNKVSETLNATTE